MPAAPVFDLIVFCAACGLIADDLKRVRYVTPAIAIVGYSVECVVHEVVGRIYALLDHLNAVRVAEVAWVVSAKDRFFIGKNRAEANVTDVCIDC